MPHPARALAPLLFVCIACGGAAPPAKSADPTASEASPAQPSSDESQPQSDSKPAASAGASAAIPTKCARSGSVCFPDPKFTKRMCNSSYPSIALYMFGNGLPFTKGYLTRRTQAWNAAGGASDNSFLEFDEEVLILFESVADAGGMQVSGAGGGYEALRWNGSCVTLAKEEVTLSKPPAPKTAKLEWRFLDDNVQEALRAESAVRDAVSGRRKECKGATTGEVSLKCVRADEKLTQVIVDYARKGGKVPVPTRLPE